MFRRICLQRKGFLLLASFGLFIPPAFSQQKAAGPPVKSFRMGFKVSPNFSWMQGLSEEVESNGAGLGFSYGVMVDKAITENYGISAEMLVSSMAFGVAHSDTLIYFNNGLAQRYSGVSFDYRLQYVELPVSLKLKTNEIGSFIWYGQFGFAPAFLVKNTLRTLSDPIFVDDKYSPNKTEYDFNGAGGKGVFRDDVSIARFSMVLGAGVEYRISGSTMLNLGLRFNNGLNDFLKDAAAIGRSNFMALNVGVYF